MDLVFFIYIRGAGSTREVWGDTSPCVGPAARDAMLLMKEAMLLTAETGKRRSGLPRKIGTGDEKERKERKRVLGGGPGGGEKGIFSAAEGGFSGDPEMRSLELGEREENG